MQTSEQNQDAADKAKAEQAEINAAVKAMKKTDWVFVAQMTSPIVFGVLALVAVAMFG